MDGLCAGKWQVILLVGIHHIHKLLHQGSRVRAELASSYFINACSATGSVTGGRQAKLMHT